LAERCLLRHTKQARSAGVPQHDRASVVDADHSVGQGMQQGGGAGHRALILLVMRLR
jgi:hypothetical protein